MITHQICLFSWSKIFSSAIQATHSAVPPGGHKFCKAQTQLWWHGDGYNMRPWRNDSSRYGIQNRWENRMEKYGGKAAPRTAGGRNHGFRNGCPHPIHWIKDALPANGDKSESKFLKLHPNSIPMKNNPILTRVFQWGYDSTPGYPSVKSIYGPNMEIVWNSRYWPISNNLSQSSQPK